MKERNIGLLSTLACYILWGLLPLYWHILEDLDSIFILCNRIIWSAVCVVGILAARRALTELWATLKSWRLVRPLMVTVSPAL